MVEIYIFIVITPEMVKQGGENYVGMLITVVIVRELAAIMAGFAIISMVGSSMAAEVATMRVSEQIDAIKVLGVNPIKYLYVPRVLAGTIMMPLVVIIATLFGIICGGFASWLMSDVSWLNYINSAWFGISVRDIKIFSLKPSVFLNFSVLFSIKSLSAILNSAEKPSRPVFFRVKYLLRNPAPPNIDDVNKKSKPNTDIFELINFSRIFSKGYCPFARAII